MSEEDAPPTVPASRLVDVLIDAVDQALRVAPDLPMFEVVMTNDCGTYRFSAAPSDLALEAVAIDSVATVMAWVRAPNPAKAVELAWERAQDEAQALEALGISVAPKLPQAGS